MIAGFLMSFSTQTVMMVTTLLKYWRTSTFRGARSACLRYGRSVCSRYRVEFNGRHVHNAVQEPTPHRRVGLPSTHTACRLPKPAGSQTAAQMLFEVLVLISTIVNALDRPQQAEMPLTRALHRDGIIYFFVSSPPRDA